MTTAPSTTQTTTHPTLTIGGEQQPGGAGSYPVHNPARPAEVVDHAPAADLAQLDAAVQAARRAAAGWRALGVAERVAAVGSAATAAAEKLAGRDRGRLYTREHGKVLAEASFEIDTGPFLASLLGGMAETALAPEQVDPQSSYPRLHREPYGVAALIVPFNWPLAVMMMKLTSALSAGNTAVIKVPPTCPLVALQFGAAFAAALPPGVVNVLAGPGIELGQSIDVPGTPRRIGPMLRAVEFDADLPLLPVISIRATTAAHSLSTSICVWDRGNPPPGRLSVQRFAGGMSQPFDLVLDHQFSALQLNNLQVVC